MPPTLAPGLYEQLITRRLAEALDRLRDHWAETGVLEEGDAHVYLAQHIQDALRSLLDGRPISEQLAICNRVLEAAAGNASALGLSEPVTERLLHAITTVRPDGLGSGSPPARPGIPLSQSALLVNARDEHRIGREIELEIASADEIDLLCSFVKWSGLRLFREAIAAHLDSEKRMRVITTAYMAVTERRALDELERLGAEVRVSYETRRTRLHAKAWLFRRATGFSTAYIGSSNLSAAAQTDGLEWNVRLSAVDAPAVLDKFEATFNGYWNDGDFAPYAADTFDRALQRQQDAGDSQLISLLDVRPYPFQQEILELIEVDRAVHGRNRNLIVAATGTGKTVVAALDYQRMVRQERRLGLLFVAHREEILNQSRSTFRHVLRDGSFGEMLVSGHRPENGRHVFASVQSLSRLDLDQVAPDAFDYLIVDEFHHAEAPTYRRLLDHFCPKYLLGLTATPERADGGDVRVWFGGRTTAELRLWDAIERQLLSPFQYFGVFDGTDLSHVTWHRGRGYDVSELENLYTADHIRVELIVQAILDRVTEIKEMRALGFCVGVAHARFMADQFSRLGIPSLAVTGDTPRDERSDAIRKLRAREVNVLFTVDLFNEGVDIPEVDTVLFLRPTESATVFLQQLGRGLRLDADKECLTVLDFIGRSRRDFKFDVRYRALVPSTQRGLERQIQDGFPVLPSGCSIQLDRQSREIILDNVRQSLSLGRSRLLADLRAMPADTDLGSYLAEVDLQPEDLYRGGRYWADLRRAAGHLVEEAGPGEDALGRALGRMLHIDDPSRLRLYEQFLSRPKPLVPTDEFKRRQVSMLLAALLGNPVAGDLSAAALELWSHGAIRSELLELLPLLRERVRHVPIALEGAAGVPLHVHCRYSLVEVMAALDEVRKGILYRPREGLHLHRPTGFDLLFVTLRKTEKHYSPSTMYRDYAVSPTEFHWQSQSTTRAESKTGQRHINHQRRGIQPILFVREAKTDERGITMSYTLLGPVDYLAHHGERPINITWKLRIPMPADVLRIARIAA